MNLFWAPYQVYYSEIYHRATLSHLKFPRWIKAEQDNKINIIYFRSEEIYHSWYQAYQRTSSRRYLLYLKVDDRSITSVKNTFSFVFPFIWPLKWYSRYPGDTSWRILRSARTTKHKYWKPNLSLPLRVCNVLFPSQWCWVTDPSQLFSADIYFTSIKCCLKSTKPNVLIRFCKLTLICKTNLTIKKFFVFRSKTNPTLFYSFFQKWNTNSLCHWSCLKRFPEQQCKSAHHRFLARVWYCGKRYRLYLHLQAQPRVQRNNTK